MSVHSLMQILLHLEEQIHIFGARLHKQPGAFCLGFFMSLLCVLALLCGYQLWNYQWY